MPLGKMPPEKCPQKIALWKIAPLENCPPGKLAPGKLPPMKFFCEFFLISNFYFLENFRPQEKSIFIQLIFLL